MSAAEHLNGLSLANGWVVTKVIPRPPSSTGGMFSQSYEVMQKPIVGSSGVEKTGFMKAFDFSRAFKPGVDTVRMLQYMTSAYDYEREVLDHCRGRKLSNVVVAIDHGEVQVPNFGPIEGRVFYLIFEMAEGDVRVQMDLKTARDSLWSMRALRDVSLGLLQVHRELIAHQDTKPSNILTYGNTSFKVADFGRSSRRGVASPHDGLTVPGDHGYAPPELLYSEISPDFATRRIGADMYMFGNLACFLFSGVNISATMLSELAFEHHPTVWTGTYREVLPYLQAAFTRVLANLEAQIDPNVRQKIITLVRELCEPDIAIRGFPKLRGRPGQYSLERYMSQLDMMTKRLAVTLRTQRKVS